MVSWLLFSVKIFSTTCLALVEMKKSNLVVPNDCKTYVYLTVPNGMWKFLRGWASQLKSHLLALHLFNSCFIKASDIWLFYWTRLLKRSQTSAFFLQGVSWLVVSGMQPLTSHKKLLTIKPHPSVSNREGSSSGKAHLQGRLLRIDSGFSRFVGIGL